MTPTGRAGHQIARDHLVELTNAAIKSMCGLGAAEQVERASRAHDVLKILLRTLRSRLGYARYEGEHSPQKVDADCAKWCQWLDEWMCNGKGLCGARRPAAAPPGAPKEGKRLADWVRAEFDNIGRPPEPLEGGGEEEDDGAAVEPDEAADGDELL